MKPFGHIDAKTVDEAISLLKEHQSKLIAGGTDLLGVLKDRVLPTYPELLVNIKSIPGLDSIEQDEEGVKIGALTRLADIAASPLVKERCPMLAKAAYSVATPQIRNMGTIGGNLAQDTRCWYYRYPREIGGNIICHRKGGRLCPAATGDNRYHAIFPGKKCVDVCPSDTAVALAALDATLQIIGPDGRRMAPVEDFYKPLGNILNPDEMITEIRIPRPQKEARQTFLKYRVREAVDFAIVSVASVITEKDGKCEEARIVLGAVAPMPFRAVKAEQAIKGKPIDRSNVETAAKAAAAGAVPLSKNAYKVAITEALVKRALERSH